MYRSPDAIPMVPSFPFPATRRREPFWAPGGILTSTVSFRSTRPSPWQVGQTLCNLPCPPQRGLRSVAGLADFLVAYVQANLGSSNRLPEIDVQGVLEVTATLRSRRFFR